MIAGQFRTCSLNMAVYLNFKYLRKKQHFEMMRVEMMDKRTPVMMISIVCTPLLLFSSSSSTSNGEGDMELDSGPVSPPLPW